MTKRYDETLLPRLQQWKAQNGEDFQLADMIFGECNIEGVIALSELFWPDFVEHGGGIFRRDAFIEELFQEWSGARAGHLGEIERGVNALVVNDLVPDSDTVGSENLEVLAARIGHMWEAKLGQRYQGKKFNIDIDSNNGTVTVTFSQA